MSRAPFTTRRGAAGVALVLVMVLVQLLLVIAIIGAPPEQELAVMRLDSLRAFYAAEAGINMALRERARNTDDDADGVVGGVSADGNPANDPALGDARVTVTLSASGADTLLTSAGRCGAAAREIETVLD